MAIAYKCKDCGRRLDAPDATCFECPESNIFSGAQTMERKLIREKISKVLLIHKNDEQ